VKTLLRSLGVSVTAAVLSAACGVTGGAQPARGEITTTARTGDAPSDATTGPVDASAPPEAIVTTVPEIPAGPCAEEPSQCTVTLVSPAAGRTASSTAEGATLIFGFADVLDVSRQRKEQELVAFLEARPAGEDPVPLGEAPGNRMPYVVAELLDAGKASVRDARTGDTVETIVRETWEWVGCGGGCRQSGRQYRIRVPGKVFFRTTDLFEDSF
jgi:hypothetical protein